MEGTPFPPAGAREMRSLFKGRREHTQPPCNSRDHPGARGYAGATLAGGCTASQAPSPLPDSGHCLRYKFCPGSYRLL